MYYPVVCFYQMPVNVTLGTTKRWKINKLTVILLRYGKFKIYQYLVIHFIYNEIMRQISDNQIHQQINQCITISLTIQMLYPSSNLENVLTFDGNIWIFLFTVITVIIMLNSKKSHWFYWYIRKTFIWEYWTWLINLDLKLYK